MDPITLAVLASAGLLVGKLLGKNRHHAGTKKTEKIQTNSSARDYASNFEFTHGTSIHTSRDLKPHLTGSIGGQTAHLHYYGQTTLGMFDRSLPGHKLPDLAALHNKHEDIFENSGLNWGKPSFGKTKTANHFATFSSANLEKNPLDLFNQAKASVPKFDLSWLNKDEDKSPQDIFNRYKSRLSPITFPSLSKDEDKSSTDMLNQYKSCLSPITFPSLSKDEDKSSMDMLNRYKSRLSPITFPSLSKDEATDHGRLWKTNDPYQRHWLGESSSTLISSDPNDYWSKDCYLGTPCLKPVANPAYEAQRELVEWGKSLPMYSCGNINSRSAKINAMVMRGESLPMY